MSIEGQPNTILTEYSPFAWVEDTTNNYITFPTAQNREITFPASIACSTLKEITAGVGIRLNSGFKIGYIPIVGDTYLGSYRTATYNNGVSMSLNTTQQRVVGSIPNLLPVGIYQINIQTTMTTSVINPYLSFAVYLKTSAPAWVNGSLRGTTGALDITLSRVNRNPTTAATEAFTMVLSGLVIISTDKAYVAIVVGEGDLTISQNITFTDTYMNAIRIG